MQGIIIYIYTNKSNFIVLAVLLKVIVKYLNLIKYLVKYLSFFISLYMTFYDYYIFFKNDTIFTLNKPFLN